MRQAARKATAANRTLKWSLQALPEPSISDLYMPIDY
jgi:hypothetical protein